MIGGWTTSGEQKWVNSGERRSWNPALPQEVEEESTPIELLYTTVMHQTASSAVGTYFTLPIARTERREQGTLSPGDGLTVEEYVRQTSFYPATVLSDSFHLVSSYDLFGNVLEETTTTDGVDLTLTEAAAARAAASPAAGSAAARASKIHSVLEARAARVRTTAVMETAEGIRVVSSSERRLTPAQRACCSTTTPSCGKWVGGTWDPYGTL